MRWRTARLAALWLVSAASLVVPGSAEQLAESSRMVLSILPWLVAAGLPRLNARDGDPADASTRAHEWTALALALPIATLGMKLDVASGFNVWDRLIVALACLVLASLLSVAARRATRSPAAQTRHAIAWLVLVPGLPLLTVALREGGRPLLGEPMGALVAIANASPLAWTWREITYDAGAAGRAASQLARVGGPLLVCIGLWLCSAGARERLDRG